MNDALKYVLWEYFVKKRLTEFVAASAFLSVPPLNYIFMHYAFKFTEYFYEKGKRFIIFSYIEWETPADQEFYNEAVAEFKKLNPDATKDQINETKKRVHNALDRAVDFRPKLV